MSITPASRVGSTLDVIAHIFAVGDLASRDMYHCLLTSSTFFQAAAPALYHTLLISHACNPLKGASKTRAGAKARLETVSPYSKDMLLLLVQKVYLEYTQFAPGHAQDYWDFDCPCYPLPNVHSVIVQNLPKDPLWSQSSPPSIDFVKELCKMATKLHMGPYNYSYDTFGDSQIYIPLLPRLQIVCLSINAQEYDSAATLLEPYIRSKSCSSFTELLIYIWEEFSYPTSPSALLQMHKKRTTAPPSREISEEEFTAYHHVQVQEVQGQEVKEISEEALMKICGFWSCTKSLHLYNLNTALSREKRDPAGWAGAQLSERTSHIDQFVQRGIHRRRQRAQGLTKAETLPDQPLPITFHTASEFFDRNLWSGIWSKEEERYYTNFVRPSTQMRKLRQQVIRETGFKEDMLLNLSEKSLNRTLKLWRKLFLGGDRSYFSNCFGLCCFGSRMGTCDEESDGGESSDEGESNEEESDVDVWVSSDKEASDDEFFQPWGEGIDREARHRQLQMEMFANCEGYKMEDVDEAFVEGQSAWWRSRAGL
ncbi:hypothetical protein L202_08160 [Cryptococcus amylolentus CBS 6039]|uniref:Uncharacterized protein n=1 Tax=Cryptococcus amylolentus CBS 6039 TaxID=1295533 RepID=A0A1E3H8Q3_9TREE|nr:hypothetical protein L202_08160 [Cryptococcus amylolentus CBS 6039]ODN72722.1 hypothetical protein L202_08160 [Cryptococcus amylolentus CBS 6039]